VLSAKQQRLIVALVCSPTARAACRKAGVSERTYRDWKGRGEFKAALDRARQEAFLEGFQALKAALPRAGGVLVKKLRSGRDADSIRAARAVFELAAKGVETLELLQRIEALEQKSKGASP
jgi:hypothetical protein